MAVSVGQAVIVGYQVTVGCGDHAADGADGADGAGPGTDSTGGTVVVG